MLYGTGHPLSSKTVFFWASVPLRLVVVPLYLTEVKSYKSSVLDPYEYPQLWLVIVGFLLPVEELTALFL